MRSISRACSKAIAWVALNDETAEEREEEIAQQVTVCLIADTWSLKPTEVARRVKQIRDKHFAPTNV